MGLGTLGRNFRQEHLYQLQVQKLSFAESGYISNIKNGCNNNHSIYSLAPTSNLIVEWVILFGEWP